VKPIFADTSFYAACLSPRDSLHTKALALAASNKSTIVTTEFVFVELGNLFSKLARRSAAIRLIHHVRSDPDTLVIPVSSELLERGFRLFSARLDKDWSFTDCLSFVVMEEHELTEALASDGDFEQAGFVALMR
jgi:predicted nucleic acid-binding protein